MRAAYYEQQGSPHDVLKVGELPDPEPGIGEVRVRVAVSGLNPTDLKGRIGFNGVKMAYPRVVPHQDGAGSIDKVGPGVPPTRVGERVWIYEAQHGRPNGTAAGYVCIPAGNAVRLPDHVSFEIGACLGIAAMTAHRCLFADGDLRGRHVLVQGGAGAVGNAAILLAKWAGAWVAATVSRPEQEKIARDAGADLVVNRKTEDVAAIVKKATGNVGVERIVDVDLINNVAADMGCLTQSGVVSAYATDNPGGVLTIPFLKAMFQGFVFRYVFVYTMPEDARRLAVREIGYCLAADAYHPAIAMKVPLERIADAHAALESGKTAGKILVQIGN